MKFKELEVYGFKSFADKLQVRFGGGITAIVGPNGCGKSNVADAIRWVLGEQSARLLRGKSMMDVIFSGTEKRKSLSFCEVMLKFDNTQRMFPSLDYNEVTISRKLYRSGESLYFINSNQCKLKDVSDLLFDGGMGREGYSIIGQGRIDELLSAKPENRRAIFEEAAGISKFKARKTEAERKLIRTRENLVRIEDILAEKGRQLEPLSAQAEKARKCLDLRDKLKEHEINIYIYQRDTAEQAKEQISSRLNAVSEELALRESEFAALMTKYKEARDSYESCDANIAAMHEELTILNVGIEKQTGEINTLRQRQEFLQENIRKIDEENLALTAEAESLKSQFNQMEEQKAAAKVSLESASNSYAELSAEYLKNVDLLTESAGKIESERRAELEAMDKLAEIKSNLSALNAEKQILSGREGDYARQKTELLGRLKAAETQLDQCSAEVDSLMKDKDGECEKFDALTAKNKKLLQDTEATVGEIADANRKFYSASSRHQLLKDIKESYEGFGAGVKNLLKNAKTERALSSRIEGVVAEIIKVEPKYETAIEIALGNAYQNVVVKNEEDANYLVDYLKAGRLGRVTFLPMTAAKPRQIEPGYRAYLKTTGCCGVASDLISYDKKYKTVMEGYLGSTVIVEDKETATEIAKKTGYNFKIVTLEGEVFAVNGSITGGSLKADRSVANIFTHEREIRELSEQLVQLDTRLKRLNADKERFAAEQAETESRLKVHSNNIHALELTAAARMESLNQYISEKESARNMFDDLSGQSDKDAARLAAIEGDLSSVGVLEDFLAKKRATANESGQEQAQALEAIRAKTDGLRESCSELKIKINGYEGVIGHYETDMLRMDSAVKDITLKINNNLLIREKTHAHSGEVAAQILELSKKSTESDSRRVKEIRTKIANIDMYKKETALTIAEIDVKRETMTAQLQQLRDKKTQFGFQLQSVDTDIEAKEQRLLEDYNLDYAQCLPFKVESYDVNKGVTEAARLKRSIFNLGDVNIGAIEQCKTAYEEYHKYSADRDDLLKAEADLIKIIKELSADMLKLFNENFEKIRANFVKIFRELFDGGTADLYLTEAEDGDPLSAGIEIVAQPPQKKLQSITLLSGGERALTAIAILFSILKLRPMPFCVLDEIEAALDDANAGRFAKYLRRFSEETQFIVITHRKPTMELSDSLYGVTMEEKGVSKIVSVKLSEAIAQVDTANSIGA